MTMRWSWTDLRRLALPVLALAMTAAAIAALVTQRQPTEYQSSVTLVVQTSAGANDTETLVRTMTALVDTEVVGEQLRTAIGSPLSVDDITDNISIERPPGSSVLTIHYTDTDADRSVRTAQELLPAFEAQVEQLEADQAGQLAPNYAIQPWGGGTVITTDLPAPILRNAAVAALLGALLGAVGAVLYRRSHPQVSTEEEAAAATGLSVIPAPRALAGTRSSRSPWHPTDVVDGLLKRLPAALGQSELPRRVLVIGPDASQQRATFVVHLVRALQRDGSPTVLVDADLEHGGLSRQLGLGRTAGLADALRSDDPPQQFVVVPDDGPARGVTILPAGRELPMRNGSAAMTLPRLAPLGRLVVNGPAPSAHQSLGPLLRAVDAVLIVAMAGTASANRLASLSALVRSLGVTAAATVLLTDDAPEVLVRPTTWPVLEAQSSPRGAHSIGS